MRSRKDKIIAALEGTVSRWERGDLEPRYTWECSVCISCKKNCRICPAHYTPYRCASIPGRYTMESIKLALEKVKALPDDYFTAEGFYGDAFWKIADTTLVLKKSN